LFSYRLSQAAHRRLIMEYGYKNGYKNGYEKRL